MVICTWIAELMSTALDVEYGYQETFYLRLFLDLVNLFLGVLLFICLVCTEQVYLLTRAKLLGRSISQRDDQDEINVRTLPPLLPVLGHYNEAIFVDDGDGRSRDIKQLTIDYKLSPSSSLNKSYRACHR